MRPGIMPAIKSFPMDSSVRLAYIMKGILGGIKMPMLPPAATHPQAILSAYLCLRISGREMVPMVTAVARLEPLTAAKPAQPPTVAIASPPGILPIQLRSYFTGLTPLAQQHIGNNNFFDLLCPFIDFHDLGIPVKPGNVVFV